MKIIEKKYADMLKAIAMAKADPSLRMKRNDVEMGHDICVAVDENGDIIGDGVNPEDPRTWPCVIMLFGADMIGAQERVKEGGNPCPVLSRFYVFDPFDPSPTNRIICVGDDIQPGTALVKVAEKQTSP